MAAAPAPSTRRRALLRLLAWLAAASLGLALGAAAGLAWLGSAGGLRWLAAQTPVQLGTVRVAAAGVSGSLWHALHVDRLRIDTPGTVVTLQDATLRWRPAALLQRRIAVESLAARQVDIESRGNRPSGATPHAPATLQLPFAVAIDRLAVADLRLGAPGALRRYGAIAGRLAYAAGHYAVHAEATTPWAQASLTGTLADHAPFGLDARLAVDRAGASPVAVALAAHGTLADFRLRGTLQAREGQARVDARLTPFAPTPIAQARLDATRIDPARLDPALPHATLDVTLALGPSTAARLQGRLRLRNTTPGPIDRQRLPLVALDAELSGNADRATARDLSIDLGAAGRIDGTLDWHRPQLQAQLQARDLDARTLYGRFAATRLSGPLDLDASAGQQTLHAALTQPGWALRLDAHRSGAALQVDRLLLSAPGGTLDASGTLSTAAPQPFTLRATLRNFDPARFGAYPAASLNGRIAAQGAVAGRSAKLALQLDPSVWRGRRFTGHATLQADAQRLWDVDAALRLGGNRLQAQGAFGRPADRLAWSIDASALAQLDPRLHGSVQGRGVLSGGLQAPAGTLTLAARSVGWGRQLQLDRADAHADFASRGATAGLEALLARLSGRMSLDLDGLHWNTDPKAAGLRIAQLRLRATAGAGLAGPLQFDATLQDAQSPAASLRTAELRIDGTRAHHALALRAQGAIGRDGATGDRVPLDLALQATGGWLGGTRGWSGRIVALDNRGSWPVHLRSPADLAFAPTPLRLHLAHAVVDLRGGTIDVADLDYATGRLRSTGRIERIDTGDWLKLFGPPAQTVRSTLVLSGDWNVDIGSRVDGRLHLARDGGDVTLLAPGGPLALGIGQATIDLAAQDDHISGRMVLQSAQGTIQASGSTSPVQRGGAWGIAGSAPLQLDAGVDIPSLAWAAPLLGPDYRAEGRVQLTLQGRGTVAAPEFGGRLDATRLRFAWPAQGLDLKDGVLQAHFTGDRLALDRLAIHGGSGMLTGSGEARLRGGQPAATLALRADTLQVLDRPDRQLVVSGTAKADLADRLLTVTAALTADRADIALQRSAGPTLSSDVVVLGRKPQQPSQPAAVPRAIRFEGSFDLGSDFHVHGMGLDAMLGGSIRVRAGDAAPPTATGSIEVVKGQYAAYGQQLQVTHGRINFAGPIDNPGLNITATRPDLPTGIEAGVTIGGSARRPVVKLTSNPAMPDSQILSWLVLGQPLDQVGPTDFGVLQTAAAALFGSSDSAPLQNRIASALGLESINVQTAPATTTGTEAAGSSATGLPGTVVTLSKRLSATTLVSFSRGLYGLSSIFSIRHALTRHLSIQTRTGTENAVDLFYTFEFD
jgi:translocation and assembly module TamB